MDRRSLSAAVIAALLVIGASAGRAHEEELHPPEVLERVAPVYPEAERAMGRDVLVLLQATIEADGRLGEVSVVESVGEAFDHAAEQALRRWRFKPAHRGGEPIASQVRVPFHFVPPPPKANQAPPPSPTLPGPPPEPAADAGAPPEGGPDAAATPAAPPAELPVSSLAEPASFESSVRGKKAPPPRATSDFVLDREVLALAPHQSAGDLLGSAPGVYVARPEGDAVAHQVYLRGFDAEHGQDIEFTVGPVPLNQPSHIHGQGYADLNFVLPEVVRSLRVTEGVYDPRQGDFAVAGSIHFDLGVGQRGFQSHTSYGSFNTFRQLALWAPRGQPEETFAAVAVRRTDGYGRNRGSLAGTALAQYAFGSGATRGLVHVAAYGARSNMAGVLRLDDVQAGRVGFYDAYGDPSATAQSAFSLRTQAAVQVEHRSPAGARTELALWLAYTAFRLRENFTGYTQRSRERPEWVGRGDLIEQEDRDFALGARASHRTRRFAPRPWLTGTFEAGLSLRLDVLDQAQNLLTAPQNETWDRRADASLRGADIGLYVDADWKITRYLRLRGGVRADVLYYDLDDRLGNFIPSFMRQTHFVGYRRTALGVAWGPRATVEAEPTRWLTLMASYGEGYRSPQARQLEEGESAPFTKVRSVEGGIKLRFLRDRLTATAAGYATFLSSDLAFDPGEGRLERVGPTSRKGFVAYLVARPFTWALASVSVTYVNATLDAPPPATATNPAPPFQAGQLLPYVPPVVLRADVGVKRDLVTLRGKPLAGRVGVGFTFLAARPLPFDQRADPVSLLDLSTSLRWWFVELGVECYNLIGARYAAVEYSFVSDWQTREVPSLIPARHLAAGAPRTVMGTLGLHF